MSAKVLGVLALFSTLFFLALVILQVLELMYYSAEPSVWPLVQ